MSSLYPKARSPFWFIRYRDPKTGKTVDKSTKLRRDNKDETQAAWKLRAEWEVKELAVPRLKSGEQWDTWVPTFLSVHYGTVALSHERAKAAWNALRAYFREQGILSPRVLTRAHCMDYVAWRGSEAAREAGLRPAKRNTALLELKILSMIMKEAVTRGLVNANPAIQLGLKRERPKEKPAITDEEITQVEKALNSEEEGKHPFNEAMRIAWEIAMCQVVRLKETCVRLDRVNLDEETITFDTKGGREHTALLHPALKPLFTRLKKEGRTHAFTMPTWWAKRWWYFFRRIGLDHLSFHCTRVTGVTRLRDAGVDERTAREYVGHSSVLVHRTYVRAKKENQRAAVNALSRSSSSKNRDVPTAT